VFVVDRNDDADIRKISQVCLIPTAVAKVYKQSKRSCYGLSESDYSVLID